MSPHPQSTTHSHSLGDPETFWSHHAARLHWHRKPSRALTRKTKFLASGTEHDHWSWFADGEISTTYNCVDRHVLAGHGDNVAIVWESPVTGVTEKYTYARLLDEVEVLAGVLREEGVQKGDVVIIYSRASESYNDSVMWNRGVQGAISYRPLVEGAIKASSFKPSKVIVWQRDQLRWNQPDKRGGQRNWQRLVKSARFRGVKAGPVPVKSTDALYIIYTSGTTGLPKGVLREAGGHAVGLELSIKSLFGIKGPGDTMFCASDIGWVVGHSYILYAPLLVGATTVLFEGKPVGTPDAGTFWRIIEKHNVNALFTAPTAMRAIRKDDPDNQLIGEVGKRGGLKSLRALFLAGERSEPGIVSSYQDLLGKYAADGALVIDNWWSSESGSPITGVALDGSAALTSLASGPDHSPLTPRPGSAGFPMPGFDVRIVDDEGNEVPRGTMGNIVMAPPLAPSAFTTLFEDEERFYRGYLKRFNGRWVDTGDAGMIDKDGYVHIMSRSDDIINVAAHRFSTGSIEQAILSHPSISEASVVGIPDPLKGHLPFAFIQPKAGAIPGENGPLPATPSPQLFAEVNALVREQIGAIASLGGIIQGRGMIPKTRSGKTLRRVLRELVEIGVKGEYAAEVSVPPTVEDAEVVSVARERVREYFEAKAKANGVGKSKL
ncbi:hypothetical protein N7519_010731 [Penicillium mononematosum]|uniref:uncharacterized protein n=1 Tax=Penicillium mononematosum TaxID=268346 RepID=UPI0025470B91|nr:uncharacterized protein N7519_010731 [Penicillium mononematosum]KAJ6180270.1 hypothetical protein N7519_010731 [Penicillium mononematosum]